MGDGLAGATRNPGGDITIVDCGRGMRGATLAVVVYRALSSFDPDLWLCDDRSDEEEEVVENELAAG